MSDNYTKNQTVDTTGSLIVEFDVSEMDSIILTPTQDIYIGFNDLSQAVFPILASSSFSISHNDFKNPVLMRILNLINKYLLKEPVSPFAQSTKIVRIYAKGQVVSSVISIAVLTGNK